MSGMVQVSKETIQSAQNVTAQTKNDYNINERKIDAVMTEITQGKVGGSLANKLLEVWRSTEKIRKDAYKHFDSMNEFMIRANNKYDDTAEEANERMSANKAW